MRKYGGKAMAKLQSIPDIIFDNTLLEAWGNIWLGTDSSTPIKRLIV